MKYTIGYKTADHEVWDYASGFRVTRMEEGRWTFITFRPSDKFPWGYFSGGMWKYDTRDEAEADLKKIVDQPYVPGKPDSTEQKEWAAGLKVIEIPDAAIAKFDEARALVAWCDAHPREGVPEGSRENSFFHRGHEIGDIGREGERILREHIKAQLG